MSCDLRFIFAAIVLVLAVWSLDVRRRGEVILVHAPLASIPSQFGPWQGRDEAIPSDVLETLGRGDFLSRTYRDNSLNPSFVNLFVAYFPSQRTGDTIHSPQNCLPGSGWFPMKADRVMLTGPGHPPFQVNRYYIAKGDDRALVLYWYWAHDRGVASEYWAKFYLIADAIRLNRSDGALIRLTSFVRPGETTDSVQQSLTSFGAALMQVINPYVPR